MAKQDDYVRVTVRIPADIYASVKDAAGEKSVNAEIVARLSGQQRTLRDEFAMAALTGIADHFSLSESAVTKASQRVVARLCFDYADAMIEAREAQP